MELTQEQRNLKRLQESIEKLDQSDLQPEQKQEMIALLYHVFIGSNVSLEAFESSLHWGNFYHAKWQKVYMEKLKGDF